MQWIDIPGKQRTEEKNIDRFANGAEELRNNLDDEERSAMVKLQKSLKWFLVRWCHEQALTK
jgi:hypothetical protein